MCVLRWPGGCPFFSRENKFSKLLDTATYCVLFVMDSYMADSCAGTAGRFLIKSFMELIFLIYPVCVVNRVEF